MNTRIRDINRAVEIERLLARVGSDSYVRDAIVDAIAANDAALDAWNRLVRSTRDAIAYYEAPDDMIDRYRLADRVAKHAGLAGAIPAALERVAVVARMYCDVEFGMEA